MPKNVFETRLLEISKHKFKLPEDMKPYPR